MTLLARSGRRHWLRHPGQATLAVIGIAMGVALVTAVDLASQSARAAYTLSAETLAGRATHHVLGTAGSLPDSLYARLRLSGLRDAQGLPLRMAPVAEARVTAEVPGATPAGPPSGGNPGMSLRLVGTDPFASRELQAFGLDASAGEGPGGGLASLLSRPGAVLVSRGAAGRMGLRAGDSLALRHGSVRARAQVLGFLEPRNRLASVLVDDLVLADIATAQEILGFPGRISRIELDLASAGPAAAAEVSSRLPPDARLAEANARARTLDSMTKAFRLNLAALSLLALLVGGFLIYNTMAFSVAQRWNLLGGLRSLGAEPGQIARLVCREAFVLSLAGTLLGLAGGVALGRGLVDLVARTVNDLYFAAHVTGLRLDPAALVKGGTLGLAMGIAASLLPAWQASRIRPRALLTRSAQETRLRGRLPFLNRLGGAFAAGAAALAWWPSGGLFAAFACLACTVAAFSLWTPDLLRRLGDLAGRALAALGRRIPRASPTLARMAVRGTGASLSRTGVAAAALMTALSVTVAMGVMVDSFRRAVKDWLEAVLVADVYASSPRGGSGRLDGRMDDAWAEAARRAPGVAGSTTYLATTVQDTGEPVSLLALDLDLRSRAAFRFLDGDPVSTWPAFAERCALLLSEPLAYRRGLRAGDSLSLPTRAGPRRFPVAGVFADYGSDQGVAMLARTCFESHWDGRGLTSLALFATPGLPADSLARRLAALPGAAAVEIHPTRSLRMASLEIFDRTFAITSVLRLAAVLVALVGLVGALAALALERAPETALLRALGLTPLQAWGLATLEAGFLGLCTGLLSLPLGVVQSALLVHVINRRSFGWTLPLQVDPWICAQAVLLGLVAGLLAAAFPAWKSARAVTARALREE